MNAVLEYNYYPFGMLEPARQYSSGTGYRYAFNGKEKDDEVSGISNQYDYGFRIYNPRIGRFLSVDPLSKKYCWNSTYAFAENTPIWGNDLDGLELNMTNTGKFITGPVNIQAINAQNIKNNQQEVIQHASSSYSPPADPKNLISLQFKTSVGAQVASEVKFLGYGLGGTLGVSQPLTNATYSENGIETSTGGNAELNSSFTAGPITVGGSIDSKKKTDLNGSLSIVGGNISTGESPSTEVVLFSIKEAFILGGSIELTINPSEGLFVDIEQNLTIQQPDNTFVAPPTSSIPIAPAPLPEIKPADK